MKQIVSVDYTTQISFLEPFRIKLRIANYLGYVADAKVLFNKNGQSPGKEGKCYLEYNKEESEEAFSLFEGEFKFNSTGYRTFYIELKINSEFKVIKINPITLKPTIATPSENLPFFEFYVYHYYYCPPEKIAGGIMYQVFVDTFYNTEKSNSPEWNSFPKWEPDSDGEYRNDKFYGGNIRGIIQKLPYIKSLGTTILYLTPIFASPSQNGYDISDYTKVNKRFGTWDDLKELKEKANSLGILLILDCVFNHSSKDNPLFIHNPEMYDWIRKYTTPKTWWGFTNLVEFNKYHTTYLEELKKWLELYSNYVDGIRLDVADSLPDFVLKYIRKHLEGKYILGEVWKNAVKGDYREFFNGDELDAVMNYQYANAIYRYLRWGNYRYFRKIVLHDVYYLYPHMYLDATPIFLSSHDIPRIPNILAGNFMKEDPMFENIWDMEKNGEWYDGEKFNTYRFRKWEYEHDSFEQLEHGKKLQKIAVFMQYTLPGIPSIFAGDEMGVVGFKDPFNRKPMPWNDFDSEMYQFYVKIGNFRLKFKDTFAHGLFEIVFINHDKCVYKRDNMIFVVNRTNRDIDISNEINGREIAFEVKDGDLEKVKRTKLLNAYNAVALF